MTTPTNEQLNDPTWWAENAPQGATHYDTDPSEAGEPWLIAEAESTYFWSGRNWLQVDDDGSYFRTYNATFVPRPSELVLERPLTVKPQAPPHRYVEGQLPPVGATHKTHPDVVIRGITPEVKAWEVVAHKNNQAVVYTPGEVREGERLDDEVYLMSPGEFTSRQAVEIREALVQELKEADSVGTVTGTTHPCEYAADRILGRFDVKLKGSKS